MKEDNDDNEGIIIPVIAGLAIGIAFVLLFAFLPVIDQQSDIRAIHALSTRKPQSEEQFFLSNLKPGHSLYAITSFQTGNGNVSITVANPTNSHAFEGCKVIQEIIRPVKYEVFIQQARNNVSNGNNNHHNYSYVHSLPQILNVTLKEYDRIPPHFVDYFERPIVPPVLLLPNNATKENRSVANDVIVTNNNKTDVVTNIASQYADNVGQSSWYIFECKKPYEAIAFPWITVGGNSVYDPGDTVHIKGIGDF